MLDIFVEYNRQSHVRISNMFNNLWYQKYGVSYDNCYRSNARYHMFQLEIVYQTVPKLWQKHPRSTVGMRFLAADVTTCNTKLGENVASKCLRNVSFQAADEMHFSI